MNIQLIGDLTTKFKPLAIIIDENGNILWTSKKIMALLKGKANEKDIADIIGTKLREILEFNNLQVDIGNESYNITKISLKNQPYIILTLDLIGDYNDYITKSYCLEKIIEDLYDGVLLTDKEGRVLIYNQSMEEMEKRERKDMIGKYIWDAYGYSDINKSEHMQVFNTGKPIINRYKAHAYHKGKPLYKSYSTLPIEKNNKIIGVYSISKNETKLQSLLSEIIELKRKFKEKSTDENYNNLNGTRFTFSDIVGSSDIMKKLIEESQAISWFDNNILIVGDTGTGKEVFAQSIHNFGKRKSQPFIGINCSAIPENLLESILFGAVKGAYTGAVDSPGLFEEAGEGTLFLDELNSMPINMQTKLLRVLQEKKVRRVGGKNEYPVKCRVMSAMNEDPYILIEEGRLRKDLFYRIAGYNIYIPSLKDRGKDLFELAEYYISKYNISMNKNITDITDELKTMMENYDWPGNIRELEHFIENTMVRTRDDDRYMRVSNIPSYILDVMNTNNEDYYEVITSINETLQDKLDNMEKKLILKALDNQMWNVTRTAERLGITRQSLIYRMRKFNIERKFNTEVD